MAKKRFSPEQVVAKLRQIELRTAGGKSLPQACKEAGITDVTLTGPLAMSARMHDGFEAPAEARQMFPAIEGTRPRNSACPRWRGRTMSIIVVSDLRKDNGHDPQDRATQPRNRDRSRGGCFLI